MPYRLSAIRKSAIRRYSGALRVPVDSKKSKLENNIDVSHSVFAISNAEVIIGFR